MIERITFNVSDLRSVSTHCEISRLATCCSKLERQRKTPAPTFHGVLDLKEPVGVSVILLHDSSWQVGVITALLLAFPNPSYSRNLSCATDLFPVMSEDAVVKSLDGAAGRTRTSSRARALRPTGRCHVANSFSLNLRRLSPLLYH